MLRSSVDGSSEEPHANRGDDPECYKSDGEVKVELGGGGEGRCWGGAAGGDGGDQPHNDLKGDCGEGKKARVMMGSKENTVKGAEGLLRPREPHEEEPTSIRSY